MNEIHFKNYFNFDGRSTRRQFWYFALFAFVAVALGGFGSIIGCLYAGIIIGLVESLGGLLIDPSFKLLYVFAIYLLVVIYKPQGLFGRY